MLRLEQHEMFFVSIIYVYRHLFHLRCVCVCMYVCVCVFMPTHFSCFPREVKPEYPTSVDRLFRSLGLVVKCTSMTCIMAVV